MAFSVVSVEMAEKIRDGGSLSLIFRDKDLGRLILMLWLEKNVADGVWEYLGFEPPVVIVPFVNVDGTSPFRSELSGPAELISWETARSIVQQAADLYVPVHAWHLEWFQALQQVVATEGDLPPSYPVKVNSLKK